MIIFFRYSVIACLSFLLSCAVAAPADIARAPVNFLSASQAKPNIFFILDDSGSMQSSALGDEVTINGYQNTIGYRSSLCNKIYYDPAITYPVPVKYDGTNFPQQDFTRALYNGFNSASTTVDLSSGFMPWRTKLTNPAVPPDTESIKYSSDCILVTGASCDYDPKQTLPNRPESAHYFVYKGDKSSKLGDNSANDHCKDVLYDINVNGSQRWTKITVTNSSGPGGADERQNFANWFSYHRTRILTMKTAIGLAFRDLSDQYRVGFTTIGYSGTDSTRPQFLKIDDFAGSHRSNFYDKLYANNPASSTPLRAALSKAGRLYAGKLLTGSDDPVRYSCQLNFSILSTDGYWNTAWEVGSYGPKKIDGQTNVGDPDNALPRPKYDGDDSRKALRVATLTVIPHPVGGQSSTIISSMVVAENSLISGRTGVAHTGDISSDAILMAYQVALAVNQNGFRAVSQENKILIVAPDGVTLGKPVLNVQGPFEVQVSDFQDISRQGRTPNTLADVAAYYYQTDLRSPELANCRSGPEVCTNNVPSVPGSGRPNYQHMITHTLGLGASGTLRYQENYATATEGDFKKIVNGTLSWPDPIFFTGPERVDDLWHAAVNGGGRYFSATNPQSLARALSSAMAEIRAATGAASAAATSSQEPAEGNNLLFATSYRSIYWDGELEARKINMEDGSISPTPEWMAGRLLDRKIAKSSDQRTIYVSDVSAPSGLKPFLWASLNETERGFFNGLCNSPQRLSQCASLSSNDKLSITGERVVNYLRGQSEFENRTENTQKFFRAREHILGAAINAPPLYVASPAFRYADDNYGAFRDTEAASRLPVVYLASNDGLLHAFNANNGEEIWAYLPPGVLPGLWRSADMAFDKNFIYQLDGTPVAADICPNTPGSSCSSKQWRTILVTGLGAAGREYFALDITNPLRPEFLWRFGVTESENLGYAMGKPIVTKRRDGTWVVVLTSGYNNINPGNGRGLVYVLNAYSGKLLDTIDTGEGDLSTPSGLSQLNAWVDNDLDNTALQFYGADLSGNLWRFDIDDRIPPAGKEALKLARLVRDGKPQPVSTRVELSEIRSGNARIPVVTVGTGRQLGVSDLSDRSIQSLYSIKDPLDGSSFGDVRAANLLVKREIVAGAAGERSVKGEAIDWNIKAGWYLDFDQADSLGERVTIDPEQQLGVIRVVTNVPDGTVCRPISQSWLYNLEYQTSLYVPLAPRSVAGKRVLSQTLAAGARTIKVGSSTFALVTSDNGSISIVSNPSIGNSVPTVRRVSWQELDEQ